MTDNDPRLDEPGVRGVHEVLADYVSSTDAAPSPGFTDWVMRSIAAEPLPRRGLLASLALLLAAPGRSRLSAQAALVVLVLVAAIGSAVVIGEVGDLLPDNLGTSPSPVPGLESPTPSVVPSEVERTPSPTPGPTPAPPPGAAPTAAPTPEESDDPSETPDPSDMLEPSDVPDRD